MGIKFTLQEGHRLEVLKMLGGRKCDREQKQIYKSSNFIIILIV
jgi:hypothetical protein